MKSYLIRVGISALTLLSIGAILLLVTTKSDALESIIYEDLTCEELINGYNFNVNVLQDMMLYYDGCLSYIDETLDGHPHGALTCRFIREHGLFVQGIVNDIAAVFNIKCADE